jgi:hypothetical protein
MIQRQISWILDGARTDNWSKECARYAC